MPDLIQAFDDHASWSAFVEENTYIYSPEYIRAIVDHALTNGVNSSFLGKLGPEKIKVTGKNFRESFVADGLNPRQRAVMELMVTEPWFQNSMGARIYAAEALSPFALAMRGRFPRFIGSEYVAEEAAKRDLYPIQFQDLTSLTLPSDVFDCVITNDCLEHVPDISGCLVELARVLRKGGVMLSTFPFSFRYENIVKARYTGGTIEYLQEREYHGNPADPTNGSLVFEIPGWQILETARAAGFSHSQMVFVCSLEKGIVGADISGILILRCYKNHSEIKVFTSSDVRTTSDCQTITDQSDKPLVNMTDLLIRANDLIQLNDYTAVASIWSQIPTASIETLENFLRSVEVLLFLQKFDVAEAVLERGLIRFPTSTWLNRQSAMCASHRGNLTLAESRYRRLCTDFADFEVARGDLVHFLLHVAAEPDRAETEAARLLQRYPSDARVQYYYAECAEARGDIDATVTRLRQISLSSNVGQLAIQKHLLLCNRLRRFGSAEQVVESAIAEDPSNAEAHIIYANIAERRADWPAAQGRWANLRRRLPDVVPPYYGEADALVKLGRAGEAAILIEQGDSLQPERTKDEGPRPPVAPAWMGNKPKTLLFCTTFSSGDEVWQERYRRWFDAIKESSIEYDQLLMVDDASSVLPQWPDIFVVRDLDNYPADASSVLVTLTPHLGRLGMFNFPGWYRSFSTAATIAARFGFDKVIHVESDAFIISERLQRYINSSADGWIALWCDTHAVPETGIQIIAGTGVRAYYEFVQQPHHAFVEKSFERVVPFTHVERGFRGGRYGEKLNYVPRDADWTMQRYSTLPVPERYFWWLRPNQT